MGLKILYIDDDQFMKVFFEGYFEEKYDIKTEGSAEDAWKLFGKGYTPDLLVLDLGLPGQNGQSFLQEFKQSKAFAHIPVIVLSGDDKSNTRISLLKLGAEDYINKPFNPEELEIKIEKLVGFLEKKMDPRYLEKDTKVSGIYSKEQ